MQVLIVEDDPATAKQLASFTSDCGHEVEACVSTEDEALQIARRTHLDFVIADADLGQEPDGIAIATTLREETEVKTIFVSSRSDPATRDRAQSAWPLAFLVKPIAFDPFWRVMKAAVDLIDLSRFARALPPFLPAMFPARSSEAATRHKVSG